MPRRRWVGGGAAAASSSTNSYSRAVDDSVSDSGGDGEHDELGEDESDADFEPSGPSEESSSESASDDDVGGSGVGSAEHSAACTCLARFSAEELDYIRSEALELDRHYKSGLVAGLVLAHLSRDPPARSPPPLPPRTVTICCLFHALLVVLIVFSLSVVSRIVRLQRR
jgi:hypothetical protein